MFLYLNYWSVMSRNYPDPSHMLDGGVPRATRVCGYWLYWLQIALIRLVQTLDFLAESTRYCEIYDANTRIAFGGERDWEQ